MLKERLRLMYIPKDGIDIKEISLSQKNLIVTFIFGFLLLFLLTAAVMHLTTHVFHNYKIYTLEQDRVRLQQELYGMKERIASLNVQLSKVEDLSDDLRNVANLEPINSDMRELGVGGPVSYSVLDFAAFPDEVSRTTNEINIDLEKLERAIHLETSSMSEISDKLKKDQDRMDCFPSISPILGGRITSKFGYRIDPFLKRMAPHKGIDIPMPEGTAILAAGKGVVRLAKVLYTPHKSYGREIVIDHGHGYKTRYAHLSKIYVRVGQKVDRWTPIGEVGETGRASGPHLHYEVLYNNKQQNPENYIYN